MAGGNTITGHRRSRRIPPRRGARWHQVILISNRLLLSSDASHLVKKLVYSPTNLAKPKNLLWFFSGFDKKKEVKLYKKKEEKKSICNLGLSGLSPRYANETRGREHLGSKGALCINLPPFHVLSHLPGILTLTFYLQYKTIFVYNSFQMFEILNIEYPWLMTFWPTSWKRQLLYRLQNGYGLLIPRDKSFPTNLNNWHPHHSNVIRLFRAASYWRL